MSDHRRVKATARVDREALTRAAGRGPGHAAPPPPPPSRPPDPGLLATPPKASALMVFASPSRLPPARNALASFLAQDWGEKELVVVNASGVGLRPLPGDHEAALERALAEYPGTTVVELRVPAAPLPSLLNQAIDAATGDWLFLWPDDNWSHPNRFSFQLARRREGCCSMLARQLRCDVTQVVAFVHHDPWGVPGTLAFPRGELRFPGTRTDCVRQFADEFGDRCVVVDNSASGWQGDFVPGGRCDPALSLSLWHGNNLQDRDTFCRAAPGLARGSWRLPGPAIDYLTKVMAGYGFSVTRSDGSQE